MPSEQPTQADLNRDLVRRYYDTILDPAGPDFAAIEAFCAADHVDEFNWGHPDSGAFTGADAMPARQRMIRLIGSDHTKATIDEIIADGPTRVVGLITNGGTDLAGNPWSMTVIQLMEVVDGKITSTRNFFQNAALLRDMALEREAAEREGTWSPTA